MDMIETVRDALKRRFAETVAASADRPFPETGVTMPNDAVWEDYARAAVDAMRDELDFALLDLSKSPGPDRDGFGRGYQFARNVVLDKLPALTPPPLDEGD